MVALADRCALLAVQMAALWAVALWLLLPALGAWLVLVESLLLARVALRAVVLAESRQSWALRALLLLVAFERQAV